MRDHIPARRFESLSAAVAGGWMGASAKLRGRDGFLGYAFAMGIEQVLIVGAGPTGLVLALWLARMGVKVRIIDKAAEPGTTSRALAVQARTLEFYQQIGLAQTVVERGHKVATLNLWVGGKKAATVALEDMGQGLSPFAFPMIFPQDEHERLLIEALSAAGIEVERCTELLGFEDDGREVRASLRRNDG